MSKELGTTFINELLSRLPEASREAVRTNLTSPEAGAALEYAGSQLHRVHDADTRLTAVQAQEARLRAWHGQLRTWASEQETLYTTRRTELEERERAAGGAGGGNGNPGGGGGTGDPPRDPNAGQPGGAPVDQNAVQAAVRAAVREELGQREGAYVQFTADATRLATFHARTFGEDLNVVDIMRHPQVGELGVEGVYRVLHKEQLDGLAAKQAEEARAKLKAEARAEVLAEQASQQTPDFPYPMGEGSPLDTLSLPADQRPKGDPATAARLYTELVGQQTSR